MPLVKSTSKAAVGQNIREMVAAGHPPQQAVAAALDTQRRARMPAKAPTLPAGKPKGEAHAEPPQTQAKGSRRVPARDGMRKRVAARIASGGAIQPSDF